MSWNNHGRQARLPNSNRDEDADYQLALRLSAELNDEQTAVPAQRPDHDADADFALAMQLQFDNEVQMAEEHHVPHTGSVGKHSSTSISSQTAWELDKDHPGVVDYHPETPSGICLQSLHDFKSYMKSSKCKCGEQVFRSELDFSEMFQKWFSGKGVLSSVIKCRSCSTSWCFGCTPEPFRKQSTVRVQGRQVSWCCAAGRLFLLWTLLCGFDQHFCATRTKKKETKAHPITQNKHGGKAKMQKKTPDGVGFGGDRRYSMTYMPDGMGYGSDMVDFDGSETYPANSNPSSFGGKGYTLDPRARFPVDHGKGKAQSAQEAEDKFSTVIFEFLKDLLPSLDRDIGFDNDPPEAVTDMLVDSKILNYCAELLRNDSLNDATKRKELYHALLSFLQTIGMHIMASRTIFSKRPVQPETVNLLTLSFGRTNARPTETALSLADSLRNLNTQSMLFLQSAKANETDFHSTDGQNMLLLCQQISEFSQYILAYTNEESNGDVEASMADLVISDVPDEQILANHAYTSKAKSIKFSPPGRFKRLITEITTLKTGLPPGIFIRYCENRPDILKVAIIGPSGTPYENGVFEFDFFCDSSFPNKAPMVQFRGTGGGRVSINPNLYADGKVCLSLLGTWSGEPWKPGESTLLQVVISLQAMIFCEEPWYNEPGREIAYHRSSEHDPATRYNQKIREHTVRHAMLTWLDDSPQLWQAVVDFHFKQNANKILQTVEEWAKQKVPNQPRRYNYAGYDDQEVEDFMPTLSGSRPLAADRGDLSSMLSQLQTALQKHGATYVIQHTPQPAVQQPLSPYTSLPQPTIPYSTPPNPTMPLPLGPPPSYTFTQSTFPTLNTSHQAPVSIWGQGHTLGSGGAQRGGSTSNAMPNSRGGSIFGGPSNSRSRYETRSATRGRGGPVGVAGATGSTIGNTPPNPFLGGSRERGGPSTRRARGGRGGHGASQS
ncbi:Nn.00g034590.m01.CDS01 [Neocucurbitaria sp. VM-36]